ncbi:hypothetical protein BURCENBC7_AP1453 [Burkholderia cenocepacia BC7]|nr:hypothetical protein BURCENBC7_AP1453 [Burkholderia cenocepacia BC7]
MVDAFPYQSLTVAPACIRPRSRSAARGDLLYSCSYIDVGRARRSSSRCVTSGHPVSRRARTSASTTSPCPRPQPRRSHRLTPLIQRKASSSCRRRYRS